MASCETGAHVLEKRRQLFEKGRITEKVETNESNALGERLRKRAIGLANKGHKLDAVMIKLGEGGFNAFKINRWQAWGKPGAGIRSH
jgi:hypothetical protein